MLKRGTETELSLERLAFGGHAVGHHEGMVVLVRGGVPGDSVRVRIVKAKRKHAEAEIVEVIRPSSLRAESRCMHFGVCGGCKWQHISYDAQLQTKQQHVADAFERIGNFRSLPIAPIIGSEETYFYRNKIEFSFSRQRWLTADEIVDKGVSVKEFGLGFHTPQRYDKVVNIKKCWLLSESSNGILNTVREFCRERQLSIYSTKTHDGFLRHLVIRQSKRTDETMVNIVTSDDDPGLMRELCRVLLSEFPQITTIVNNITARKSMVAFGEKENVYFGPGYITERMGGFTFRISANSFFQTNTPQAERLYEVVRSLGNLSPKDDVFDLYCGTGTIAIYISNHVAEVAGIDVVAEAIEDAKLNAALNSVRNCRFVLGDLKDKLTKDTSWISRNPDVVILDPPRSGLHPKVAQQVAALNPSRIVYASCNPTTQARDVRIFADLGYELRGLQPLDMFPHTYHVENVALIERTSPRASDP